MPLYGVVLITRMLLRHYKFLYNVVVYNKYYGAYTDAYSFCQSKYLLANVFADGLVLHIASFTATVLTG